MRLAFAAAAIAALFMAPVARAQSGADDSQPPEETLTHFLSRCDTGNSTCRLSLVAGFHVAHEEMAFICPPDGLTEDEAAAIELKWLRNAAAANEGLANGGESEAEFTALSTLWPCE